jgi:hypothetical protein
MDAQLLLLLSLLLLLLLTSLLCGSLKGVVPPYCSSPGSAFCHANGQFLRAQQNMHTTPWHLTLYSKTTIYVSNGRSSTHNIPGSTQSLHQLAFKKHTEL